MRLVIFLMMLLCISSVVAVSLQIPDYDSVEVFKVGQNRSLAFTVRNDGVAQSVYVFARVSSGILKVDGLSESTKQVNLAAYESKEVSFKYVGVSSGNVDVTYGVRFGTGTDSSAVGFEQVVQQTFAARVTGSGVVPPQTNSTSNSSSASPFLVTVPALATVSTAAGGAGGGGGIVVNDSAPIEVPVQPVSPKLNSPDKIESVTGAGGSTDTMVVDDGKKDPSLLRSAGSVIVSATNVAGKTVAMLFLGLLLVTFLLQSIAYNVAKGVDS